MTGEVADLPALVALKRRFGFRLYLDDAHGFGVLGPGGRGTAASQGVEADVDLLFATFSKSIGSIGGFVAGDRALVEYLRHNVRTLIFSAALPPASAAAALASLRVMRRSPELFVRMWDNVALFKQGVEAAGFNTLGSRTPIVPLFIGSEALAFAICREAFDRGVFTTPAVDPAVPKGHALIRTSVSAAHEREHIQQALDVLAKVAKRWPIPRVDPATVPVAAETDLSFWARKYLGDRQAGPRRARGVRRLFGLRRAANGKNGVEAAKGQRVGNGRVHLHLARLVRYVVQIALRVRFMVVRRRWHHAVLDRHQRGQDLDRP